MAAQDVQAIVKRAFMDDTFRLGLMRNFQATVDSYSLELTDEESDALKDVDWMNLGVAAGGGGAVIHIAWTAA